MRPSLVTLLSCLSLLLVNLMQPGSAICQESGLQISAVTIGFEGRYKSGYWTSVRVTLRNGSQPFRGEIQMVAADGDGVATRYRWNDLPLLELASGESRTVDRLVKMGRSHEALVVEARADEKLVARFHLTSAMMPAPISSERALILTYGPTLGVSQIIGGTSRAATRTEICDVTSAEQFPTHWLGMDAVDTLLLTTSDLSQLQAISADQLVALREWVLYGGRLVWCVGKNGRELLGEQGRFIDLAPGKFQEVASLRNVSPLEAYTGSTERLDVLAGASTGIPFTVLTDVDGKVELADTAFGSSRPLIVRSALGFGQTVFVALDLDLAPLAGWEGRGRIVSRLLQETTTETDRRNAASSALQGNRFGYQDMVGQLRSGLDQFPRVTFVGFSWVAGLVLLYVVMIGPVDYFLVRDVFRRMTLTWLTFPLLTLAFAALAVSLIPRWKGSEVQLNQADVVDVDATTGRVRATTWAHLYSPRAAIYELSAAPQPEMAGVIQSRGNVLSWHGLPGTGLGGLDTAAAAPPAIDECQLEFLPTKPSARASTQLPDEATVHTVMRQVPVHVAATKSLLERWWGEIRLSGAAALTVDVDGLLRGELINPLPVELTECVVYFDNWAYRLDSKGGVLAPGETTRVDQERALNLQWRLTGRRVIESKDISTPWDQQTLVVPRILEMMMFHAAAGGDSYTQLVNHHQPYIDLTSHLSSNRAILIGRSRAVATQLSLDDRPIQAEQPWTYFRIVFPVTDPRRK